MPAGLHGGMNAGEKTEVGIDDRVPLTMLSGMIAGEPLASTNQQILVILLQPAMFVLTSNCAPCTCVSFALDVCTSADQQGTATPDHTMNQKLILIKTLRICNERTEWSGEGPYMVHCHTAEWTLLSLSSA